MSSTQEGKCAITQYVYGCLQVWVLGVILVTTCVCRTCVHTTRDHAMLTVYPAILKFFWSTVLHVFMSFIEIFSPWYTSAPEGGGMRVVE